VTASVPGSPSGIPITVGITGHRDPLPADVARLSALTRDVLLGYRTAFPSTPLLFFSALATGADQIAAAAALECEGVTLVATLPMPVADYLADFDEEQSVVFHSLLARCRHTLILGDDSMTRDARYQFCSRYLARNCHVLLAMWNGQPPVLVGGTADTVYFKVPSATPLPDVRGRPSVMTAEPGVTIWLPTPRRSDVAREPRLDEALRSGAPLLLAAEVRPVPWRATDDQVAANIERLNCLGRTLGPPAGTPAEWTGGRGEFSWTAWVRDTADVVAVRSQRSYRWVTRALLGTGLMLLLAFDAFSLRPSLLTAVSHLVIVTAVVATWVAMSRSGVRDRFQQMRALAEGARIQEVWADVGLTDVVSDTFLPGQVRAEWIRRALRTTHLLDEREKVAPRTDAQVIATAREWIGGQCRYFYGDGTRPGSIRRNRLRARRLLLLAVSGIGLALVTLVPSTLQAAGPGAERWLITSAGLLWTFGLGIAFAFTAYEELMGYWGSAQWYEVSAAQFRAASGELGRIEGAPSEVATVRDLVATLGQQALTENGYWLALSQATSLRPV